MKRQGQRRGRKDNKDKKKKQIFTQEAHREEKNNSNVSYH